MTPEPQPTPEQDAPVELTSSDAVLPHLSATGAPFDPTRSVSRVRTVLAIAGFSLFAVVILLFLIPVVFGLTTWDRIESAATVILPAVTAVTGTVTAFYFAADRDSGKNRT